MIAVLCMASAWADPVALRGPVRTAGATAGLHELSVGAPLPGSPLDVALEATTPLSAVGASIGRRWTLWRSTGAARWQAGLAGGVYVPTLGTSPGLTVTAWTHVGWTGRRAAFTAGLASPTALGARTSRWPLLVELQGGLAAGPVWVVPRLAAGPVLTPQLDTATWIEPALLVQVVP